MMKKKNIWVIPMLAFSNISAQCYSVKKSDDTPWNGKYIATDSANFYDQKIYAKKEGTYFLHRDADTWYINTDMDSPDEEVLAYSSKDSETPPLEGWKTIDGSAPPKITVDCE